MRLREFTEFKPENFEEILITLAKKISAECTLYLKMTNAFSESPKFLYRGVAEIPSKQHPTYFLTPLQVRQDRRPRDTHPEIHALADEWLNKHFGIRGRSQGLFTAGASTVARDYGEVCIVFPIGEFNYLWSEHINDLTAKINQKIYFDNEHMDQTIPMQTIKNLKIKNKKSIVDGVMSAGGWHFNEGFNEYMAKKRRHEMTLFCPNGYYAIPMLANMGNLCWRDVHDKIISLNN